MAALILHSTYQANKFRVLFFFQYSESKSFCEDLTEGKFSFPIIHAVTNQKQDRQVLRKFLLPFGFPEKGNIKRLTFFFLFCLIHADILRQRTKDVEVKKYCIQLLEKMGSFNYTRETLETLDKQARAEVSSQT